jgi:hypothetical protein
VLTRLRRRLTYANVVATFCLFMVLAGGSAFAAKKLTGAQIANNAITSKHIKNRSLLAIDFKAGQLPRGKPGAPGAAGAPGAPGPAGAPGTARAYGFVDNSSGTATMTSAAGGVSVRRAGNGTFCITAPGIDPNTTPIVVTPHAKSGLFAYTIVGSGLAFSQLCTGSEFQVLTLDPFNFNVGLNTSSFMFVIP